MAPDSSPPPETSPKSAISPWQLGGLTVAELGKRVWTEFWADEITDRAAALAYYFLFALFPALLFMTALLGMLPIPDLMDRLMGYVSQALPGDAASLIQKTLGEIIRGASGGILSFGVLAALWAGSNGMASVMSALNVAYDVEEARPFIKRKLVAIGLTLGFSLFIILALVLMAFGPKLGDLAVGWLGLGDIFSTVWNILSIPIAMVFVGVGIALVYYLAPNTETTWHWVTPGSLVALVVWVLMSLGLRWYVSNFADYNATYGSIAGVILLMLWLYLTGVVLLLGAEVNSEIEHAAAERGAVTAKAPGERAPGVPAPGPALSAVPGGGDGHHVGRRSPVPGALTTEVSRLAKLDVELAVAEGKRIVKSAVIAVALAVIGLVIAVSGVVVLAAGAFAPLFDARWVPLVVAGGAGLLGGGAAVAWAVSRLRSLEWARPVAAVKEDWRWAGSRLKSGLT